MFVSVATLDGHGQGHGHGRGLVQVNNVECPRIAGIVADVNYQLLNSVRCW